MSRDRPWQPELPDMIAALLALAADRRRPRRRTVREAEAIRERARRRYRRRRREATRRAIERQAPARRARSLHRRFGERIIDRLLLAMQPGRWYGRGDLVRLAGLSRAARGKVNQHLLAARLVERRRNPAWRAGERFPQPWEIMGGADLPEPPWLYRMTSRGELVRAAAELVA